MSFILLLLFTTSVFAKEDINFSTLPSPMYQVQDCIVRINHNGKNIVGTWTIPKHIQGNLPTLVLFHGFTANRNGPGDILKTTATALATQGFDTLRIDFLGSGESDGQWADSSLTSRISDAEVTLQYIKKNSHS